MLRWLRHYWSLLSWLIVRYSYFERCRDKDRILRDGWIWIYNHVLYYQLKYLSKQRQFHVINSSFHYHPISQIIAVKFHLAGIYPPLSRSRYPFPFPNNKIRHCGTWLSKQRRIRLINTCNSNRRSIICCSQVASKDRGESRECFKS
jgi:hypothetical protein